jgi:microcystin degradation protein MlrC
MATILIAGLQHETNTFSPSATTLQHFQQADSWPALLEQQTIFNQMKDKNIPLSGFIAEMQDKHQLIPLLWCSATPSGKVTANAYDHLEGKLLQLIEQQSSFDAIYLDLHGAMVSEQHADADGELLKNIRQLVGPDCFIAASLDLHANVSLTMFQSADFLQAYQTYPHIDMAATGKLVGETMNYYLEKNNKPHKQFHQFNFLIPITSQCSLIGPAKSIYQTISTLNHDPEKSISFSTGFPLADTANTGPSLLSYAQDHNTAEQQLQKMTTLIESQQPQFSSKIYTTQKALDYYANKETSKEKPTLFIDTQDNPGCGGSGDTTGILQSLIEQDIKKVLIVSICDPDTVKNLTNNSIGDEVTIELGGKVTSETCQPVKQRAQILNKCTGEINATGPFYQGCQLSLGQCALLRIKEIDIIVTSTNVQAADQAIIRHFGIEPTDYGIIVLKSSVHFRADFSALADDILLIESPGLNVSNLKKLDYQHLRHNMTLL